MRITKRNLTFFVLGFVLAIIVTAIGLFVASPADSTPVKQANKLKCGKECQKSNDWFLHAHDYDDYFVNDSDGGKDMVFSVYRNIPIPVGEQTVQCSIIKNDSGLNYSIAAVICPGNVSVSGVPGPQGPKGDNG
jgi:hypothetical protein